jgi:hypothetical protein
MAKPKEISLMPSYVLGSVGVALLALGRWLWPNTPSDLR